MAAYDHAAALGLAEGEIEVDAAGYSSRPPGSVTLSHTHSPHMPSAQSHTPHTRRGRRRGRFASVDSSSPIAVDANDDATRADPSTASTTASAHAIPHKPVQTVTFVSESALGRALGHTPTTHAHSPQVHTPPQLPLQPGNAHMQPPSASATGASGRGQRSGTVTAGEKRRRPASSAVEEDEDGRHAGAEAPPLGTDQALALDHDDDGCKRPRAANFNDLMQFADSLPLAGARTRANTPMPAPAEARARAAHVHHALQFADASSDSDVTDDARPILDSRLPSDRETLGAFPPAGDIANYVARSPLHGNGSDERVRVEPSGTVFGADGLAFNLGEAAGAPTRATLEKPDARVQLPKAAMDRNRYFCAAQFVIAFPLRAREGKDGSAPGCIRCGSAAHPSFACPRAQLSARACEICGQAHGGSCPALDVCFACDQPGHIVPGCPHRAAMQKAADAAKDSVAPGYGRRRVMMFGPREVLGVRRPGERNSDDAHGGSKAVAAQVLSEGFCCTCGTKRVSSTGSGTASCNVCTVDLARATCCTCGARGHAYCRSSNAASAGGAATAVIPSSPFVRALTTPLPTGAFDPVFARPASDACECFNCGRRGHGGSACERPRFMLFAQTVNDRPDHREPWRRRGRDTDTDESLPKPLDEAYHRDREAERASGHRRLSVPAPIPQKSRRSSTAEPRPPLAYDSEEETVPWWKRDDIARRERDRVLSDHDLSTDEKRIMLAKLKKQAKRRLRKSLPGP